MNGNMIIDGRKIPYTNQKNILSVIRDSGIDLPTFCYHSELSIYGACRMCSVETAKGE
ncbi:MAG: 2Fe-2S iron-sulfur cluster-binding protein, partial [Sedimentibacter sp.]